VSLGDRLFCLLILLRLELNTPTAVTLGGGEREWDQNKLRVVISEQLFLDNLCDNFFFPLFSLVKNK